MRSLLSFFFVAFSFMVSAQDERPPLYFKELGWKINIPDDLKKMDPDLEKRTGEKGLKALLSANGFDTSLEVKAYSTLFALHYTEMDYMDAKANLFDKEDIPDWEGISDSLNIMVYNTIKETTRSAVIDSATTREVIGGLQFKLYTLTIPLPQPYGNMHLLMYTRLINGYDFGLNILYIDKNAGVGKRFLSVWRSSVFE